MTAASFNSAVQALDVPAIPMAASWAENYDGRHGQMIDLSQAVPNFTPHENLMRALSEAATNPESLGYGPIEGEAPLRAAYAANVNQRYNASIKKENIHITSGCNQAFIASLMAVAGHGDSVLMTNPCYFNHEATAKLLGIDIKYVDCEEANGFQPSINAFEDQIDNSVKAIALVSPNNPTGAIYSADLLDRMLALCEKRGIWLIIDETYRDFLPDAHSPPHRLLHRKNWHNNLIQLYSFSKTLCIPGHRLGAVTAGSETVDQIAKVMDNIQICAPRAAQLAVAEQLPILGQWISDNSQIIQQRANAFIETMAYVPDWSIRSMGAYFAYVEHPYNRLTSTQIVKVLASEFGVLPLPGSFFGFEQERYLRVAFANVDSSTLSSLGDRLKCAEERLRQLDSKRSKIIR